MRRRTRKSLLVLFLSVFILMTIFTTASSADVNKWTPQNTGTYNPVDVIAFGTDLTNNIYAGTGSYLGTGGLIYRSADKGVKWDDKLNSSPFSSYVYVIQVDPTDSNIIYAGTYNGVYKTIDGGVTWTSSNGSDPNILTNQDYVWALAIDPLNHNRIYAGTRGGVNSPNSGKVFLSEDGGVSWVEKGNNNNGLSNVYVLSLLIDPNNPLVIYVGTTGGSEQSTEKSGGVYRTTNGGLSWTASSVGLSSTWINALAIDPLNTSIVYAATTDGVFKSIDGGASWKQYKTGITFQHISSVIVDSSIGANTVVYAGGGFKPYSSPESGNTSGGVFRSINGGEEWIPINTGLKQASTGDISTRIYSLIFKPGDNNTIYAGTNDGIYGYTINANAPKTPTGFRLIEEGDKKVVLGWNANTETDLGGYRIYRWNPVSKLYEKKGDDVSISKVTFTDAAVANNVTYFYKLSAFNIAGFESPQTDYIYATPKAYVEIPVAPAGVSSTGSSTTGSSGSTSTASSSSNLTGEIKGRVVNPGWIPISNAAVKLVGSTSVTSMTTNSNGEFRFANLYDGLYTAFYDAPGYISQTQILLVLSGGITNAPTVIMSTGPTGQIRGRMINTAGQPIPGSTARINNITMFPYPGGDFAFTLMADGIYTVFYDAPGYISQTQVLPVINGGTTNAPTVIMSSSAGPTISSLKKKSVVKTKKKKKVKVKKVKKKAKVKAKKKK